MRKLILIVIGLGLMSLSSADYYLVGPTGEMGPAEKTEIGWKPAGRQPSHSDAFNPGFIDTVFWENRDTSHFLFPPPVRFFKAVG